MNIKRAIKSANGFAKQVIFNFPVPFALGAGCALFAERHEWGLLAMSIVGLIANVWIGIELITLRHRIKYGR